MNNLCKLFFLVVILLSNILFAQNNIHINYVESNEIISNPERGFSVYKSSQITGAFINTLQQFNVTVIQRIYTIPQFNNKDLTNAFLNIVESDLNSAREGGVKLVLRFSYTDNQNGSDAPLDVILRHIEQLKPLFRNNYDVIVYVEAGFIGAWGEWYYSSNNLNNTNDRRTVLFALLDALPEERCVVVRTPNYKRLIFNDPNPITLSEAFNGTRKSRTGAHNDCFLASATDFGTYIQSDIEGDKAYLNRDNKFVPQGGETCSPSSYSGCNNALTDLARMHWSILNRDYNTTVLNSWKTAGCYDEIQKKMGYRFVLLESEISDSVKPSCTLITKLKLVNNGFASLFNPRNVELILRKTDKTKQYRLNTNEDPRFWFSGDTIEVEISGGILNNMEEGNYEILLHIADPVKDLHDRPEYAIQLANENIWEELTGFNSLNHIVKISNKASGSLYNGDSYFLPDTLAAVGISDIVIDGEFDDWQSVPQLDLSPNTEEAGDALNGSTDIVDVWAADDENKLYISYSLDSTFSEQYFYHIFFDTDSDTSTGFHSANSYAGIDLMIENDLMWRYTGTNGEWSWEPFGNFTSSVGTDNKRIELSISKDLFNTFSSNNKIEFLINVNDDNENIEDDYAPNNYTLKNYEYNYLVTSVKGDDKQKIKNNYSIKTYPNPFNNSVIINFNVERKDIKSLNIYNSLGQLVKKFSVNDLRSNFVTWNAISDFGINQSSGVYIIRLQSKENVYSNKIVLLK